MPRVLVAIVFVCCLAAASAVTAVITSDIVTGDLVASAATSSALPTPAPSPPAAPAERPAPAPAGPVQVAPAPAEVESDPPTAEEQSPAAAELAATDARAFVNELSPEQQQKLAKALLDRRLVDIRKRNSYILPTDYRLSGLAQVQDGRLALSEGQQQAIKDIRETFKARIDAATGELRDRDEDVRYRIQKAAETYGPGGEAEHADEFKELRQEWAEVRQELRQAKAEIDKDYAAAVGAVLTPDQNGALSGVPLPAGLVGGSDNRP